MAETLVAMLADGKTMTHYRVDQSYPQDLVAYAQTYANRMKTPQVVTDAALTDTEGLDAWVDGGGIPHDLTIDGNGDVVFPS